METDTTSDSITLDCGALWKLSNEILLIRFKDGFNLGLEEAKSVRNASFDLMEGRKFLSIIDARNIGGSLGKEASHYFAQNEELANRRMAQAIIVNTLALKLVARFYMRISQPLRPAKIFNTIEAGMDWLETQKYLLD